MFTTTFISKKSTISTKFSYAPNSYGTYENNGVCYNLDTSYTRTYSQSFRDDLFTMSDHSRVIIGFQVTQNILSIDEFTTENNIRVPTPKSNLIHNNVSLYINPKLFNSGLLIQNQLR
ncbi:MAG: hypothetical protein L3J14_02505 [Flavobacteriaceae bacterium]|nr:hypothetical protein [Flavobacteriaceae bacterium]